MASKADASREAVRDGELGLLVDPHSPADIQAGILKALKESKKGGIDGLNYFSSPRFEERLRQIIDRVSRHCY